MRLEFAECYALLVKAVAYEWLGRFMLRMRLSKLALRIAVASNNMVGEHLRDCPHTRFIPW